MTAPVPAVPNRATGLPPGVEVGPLGRRLVAHVIDSLVPAVVGGVVGVLVPRTSGSTQLVLEAVGGVLTLAWAVLVWYLFAVKAAGPGMRVMKLQLVGFSNGRAIGWGRFLIRQVILFLVSALTPLLVVMIILLVLHPRKQGWHDLAAGSVVIKARVLPPTTGPRPGPPAMAGSAPAAASAGAAPRPLTPPPGVPARPATGPYAQPVLPGQSSPGGPVPPGPYPPNPYAPGSAGSAPGSAASGPGSAASGPGSAASGPGSAASGPGAYPYAPGSYTSPPPYGGPPPYSPPGPGGPQSAPPASAGTPPPVGPAPSASGPAAPVAQPSAPTRWSAMLDDGRLVPIDGLVLLGRNPQPKPGEEAAQLVKLADETRTVSKSHLAIGLDETGVYVIDRGSTNGSTVTTSAGVSTRCQPDEMVYVNAGSIVSIGDHWLEIRRRTD